MRYKADNSRSFCSWCFSFAFYGLRLFCKLHFFERQSHSAAWFYSIQGRWRNQICHHIALRMHFDRYVGPSRSWRYSQISSKSKYSFFKTIPKMCIGSDCRVVFAQVGNRSWRTMEKSGFVDLIGEEWFHESCHDAVDFYVFWFDDFLRYNIVWHTILLTSNVSTILKTLKGQWNLWLLERKKMTAH